MSVDVYTPDSEEIQDAVTFLTNCSSEDLQVCWSKISSEWDISSVTEVHRVLCKTGRINTLLAQLSKE